MRTSVQIPCSYRSQVQQLEPVISVLGGRQENPKTCWPIKLAKLARYRFSKGPCLKIQSEKDRKTPDFDLLVDTRVQTHTHVHTHTQSYIDTTDRQIHTQVYTTDTHK